MRVPDLSLEETRSDYTGHVLLLLFFMYIILHWNSTAEANVTENFVLRVVSKLRVLVKCVLINFQCIYVVYVIYNFTS